MLESVASPKASCQSLRLAAGAARTAKAEAAVAGARAEPVPKRP